MKLARAAINFGLFLETAGDRSQLGPNLHVLSGITTSQSDRASGRNFRKQLLLSLLISLVSRRCRSASSSDYSRCVCLSKQTPSQEVLGLASSRLNFKAGSGGKLSKRQTLPPILGALFYFLISSPIPSLDP